MYEILCIKFNKKYYIYYICVCVYVYYHSFIVCCLLLYRTPPSAIVLPPSRCSPSSFADHTTTEIVRGLSKMPLMETHDVMVPGNSNTWPRPKVRKKKKVRLNILKKNYMIDQLCK